MAKHEAIVRRLLDRSPGRAMKTLGDGLRVTFDGPASPIRSGCSVVDAVRAIGIEVRVGIDTGAGEHGTPAPPGDRRRPRRCRVGRTGQVVVPVVSVVVSDVVGSARHRAVDEVNLMVPPVVDRLVRHSGLRGDLGGRFARLARIEAARRNSTGNLLGPVASSSAVTETRGRLPREPRSRPAGDGGATAE